MSTVQKSYLDYCREAVESAMGPGGSGVQCYTFAELGICAARRGTKRFARILGAAADAPKCRRTIGVVLIECYGAAGYDDDPLSETGAIMLHPTDDRRVHGATIRICAGADDQPDLPYLFRADGKLLKTLHRLGMA